MTAIRIGMDVGSTTVKAVVLDQGYGFDAEGQRIHQPFSQDDLQVLFADYRRHHANVRATAQELLTDIHQTLAAAGRGRSRSNWPSPDLGVSAWPTISMSLSSRKSSPRPTPSKRPIPRLT